MKRILAGTFVALLWCSAAWAWNWGTQAPGGGGNFNSVAVSSTGAVLVAGDVSGLYLKGGASGSWSHIGYLDGLNTTKILCVAYCPTNPAVAIAGAHKGLYRSTDAGVSWSQITGATALTDSSFGAICWGRGADSASVYALCSKGPMWRGTSATSAAGTLTWSNPGAIRDTAGISFIKSVFDASGAVIYCLAGVDGENSSSANKYSRQLWRSSDTCVTFSRVDTGSVDIGGAAFYKSPIDICVRPDTSHAFFLTTSSALIDPTDNSNGSIYYFVDKGATIDTALQVTKLGSSVRNATGSVWCQHDSVYVVTTGLNIGGSNTSGLWRRAKNGAYDSWSRIDEGTGGGTESGNAAWDTSWAGASGQRKGQATAYGQTGDNVARSVCGGPDGKPCALGTIWVTSLYAWQRALSSTGKKKFGNAMGSNSAPFQSLGIDNINAASVLVTASSVWSGHYDCGLFKDGFNKNPADTSWTGPDFTGGNVNSILALGGDTLLVSESPSSKSSPPTTWYQYRLWRTTNGGSSWAKYGSSGTPDLTLNAHFLRSLAVDPLYGAMYICRDSSVLRSVDRGATWSAVLDTGGCFTVATYGTTVLAGGYKRLYRSSNGGTTWSVVKAIGDDKASHLGDITRTHREQWNGLHALWYDTNRAEWWGAIYSQDSHVNGGLWYSPDDGVTWTEKRDVEPTRGVFVDSCGSRVWVTSGTAFSGGEDNASNVAVGKGIEVCRWDGSTLTPKSAVEGALYRWLFGAGVAGNGTNMVAVSVPGYGVLGCSVDVGDGVCGIVRPFGAQRVAPEPPMIGRRVFTVQEAAALVRDGKLELFDVSGRRSRTPGPGVYFSVLRDRLGAITVRRTVLVTR